MEEERKKEAKRQVASASESLFFAPCCFLPCSLPLPCSWPPPHGEMSAETPLPLFYEEDLVSLAGDAGQVVATIVRTWHEEWDDDDDDDVDLKTDEYLLQWISGRRQAVNGTRLTLRDRAFQLGDICEGIASPSLGSSGVVTNVRVDVSLQSTATASRKAECVASTALHRSACIEQGDHVIYKNWIGVVELVFEEALLNIRGANRPYKVYCVEGGLQYGNPSETVLDTMQGLVTGKSLGAHITSSNSRVVAVRQTAVYVSWLAINQKVS